MSDSKLAHKTIWGEAWALLDRSRRFRWVDLLVLVAIGGLLYGLVHASQRVVGPRATVEIDLSPWALPGYTLQSLFRGLLAYGLSLVFTLIYGYWAAKDRVAERVLIPLLDVLQSIPVLGFMPGVVLAMVNLFPHSNIGLELAAVITIFTGQVWNMTFSYYHSVISVPADLQEVGTIYRFSPWRRWRCVELPYSMMGLVWNSMMSMAGGWFFLMLSEAFKLGDREFRLPGVGSYMSVAVDKGDVGAMIWAVVAMTAMIVALDQLLWRPVVVWAQKFRFEEGGQQEEMSSWLLDWLRDSHILLFLDRRLGQLRRVFGNRPLRHVPRRSEIAAIVARGLPWVSFAMFFLLIAILTWGAFKLVSLMAQVSWADWRAVAVAGAATLARVLAAVVLGTLWALPAGLAIGLSPRLSRIFQPIVQVVASFPAPMLFPAAVWVFAVSGITLDWGSIVLMLLGTQWYILFNVIAGTMAIPSDLREVAQSYRLKGWQRFRTLYFPAVFPYLVTGWVTAAGGAWNASIVAEYFTFRSHTLTAVGLGAQISHAYNTSNYALLAASIAAMSLIVVVFNRSVWRRCYLAAETKFSLSK